MARRVKRGDDNYSEVCAGRVEETGPEVRRAAHGHADAEKQSRCLNPWPPRLRRPCPRPPADAGPAPQEKQDKAVLQSEVASLRQNNQRLQEESQAASEQLRKFAEIFCREKKEL